MTPESVRAIARSSVVLIPMATFVIHASAFNTWIVDDAGISFAYAKHLAAGAGLVHQPGADPVEGFSNPAWVLLLSAFFALKIFHPIWIPKLLATVLVGLAFELQRRSFVRYGDTLAAAATFAAVLASLQTGFVAWCVSGLENSLYVCGLSWLAYQCGTLILGSRRSSTALLAGVAAFLVAWTRPEGIIYSVAFPVIALSLASRSGDVRKLLRATIVYGTTVVVPSGAYVAFRYLYFHDWLPNTYYAKGGPRSEWLFDVLLFQPWSMGKVTPIVTTMTGDLLVLWLPVATLAGLIVCVLRNQSSVLVPAVFTCISAIGYVLLPGDWMPAHRFGTPLYFFGYVLCSVVAFSLLADPSSRLKLAARWSLVAIALVATGIPSIGRTRDFASNLPIPISEVRETAHRFERFASILEVPDASLLYADIGAFAFESEVTIVDLGMLCDRTIAKSIGEGVLDHDPQAFYDYVFIERRPLFIATRAYHSWLAHLARDPRFARDYVPIREYPDEWILKRYREARMSGDYVRRNAVTDTTLAVLRSEATGVQYAGCDECGVQEDESDSESPDTPEWPAK